MTTSSVDLHLIVPGALSQRTGGYLYDARMVEGLRGRGWGVRVHELEGRFPQGDRTARESLASALEDCAEEGGVVVADGLAVGGLPELLEAQTDLPLVTLVHHPLADESGLEPEVRAHFQASERRALARADGTVVTSPFTARRLEDYGVPPGRVRVVVPGTEPARPARGPGVGSPPRLVSVGSVTPRKGHDVLVEALERLRDRSWVCVCAGSLERAPDFAREVRTRVSAAGLESRILFLGELDADELEAVYGTASLFVLPSRFEGYGMALTEALARGLPVVSTTGGAIPGTVPADVGILVPPGDAPALAEALAGLLESPERLEERAAAARRYAAELPDWSTQVEAFGRAVVELAGAGPPATRCEGGGS